MNIVSTAIAKASEYEKLTGKQATRVFISLNLLEGFLLFIDPNLLAHAKQGEDMSAKKIAGLDVYRVVEPDVLEVM